MMYIFLNIDEKSFIEKGGIYEKKRENDQDYNYQLILNIHIAQIIQKSYHKLSRRYYVID